MKILRRYFGYTTNSSSASEFVLSDDLQRQIEEAKRRKAIERGEIEADAVQEDGGAPATAPSTDGSQGEPPPARPAAERPSPLLENALVIGGLLLAVLGVFALERMIRRAIRKAKERDDEV